MTKFAKTVTFFMVAMIVLCAGVIASLVVEKNNIQTQNNNMIAQQQRYKQQEIFLENIYEKALAELADSLDNMQANLSKLHASNGVKNQHLLITKIVSEAEVAESDIGELPVDNRVLKKVAQFANKTSDFCTDLQQKLAGGKTLSQNDRKTLKQLSSTSQVLAKGVADISQRVGNDFLIIDSIENKGKTEGFDKGFDNIDEQTFDYPQMIYDGPFADAKEQKIVLNMPEFSRHKAEQKIKKELKNFGVKAVNFAGEIHDKTDLYNFDVEFDDGGKCYIQATKRGGIICYMSSCGCKGKADSKQSATTIAEQFANSLGYDVKAVWVSKQNDGPTYVNLAPVVSGVIIYPDLVKVSVDKNGVCGFEGFNYLANHKNRVFDKMLRDDKMARERLADGMVVKNSNLALVSKNSEEILCFEFECEMDGEQYFVFINADTLQEVDIFKVIKGSEGYTVI